MYVYYLKGKRDVLLTNFYFCAKNFHEVKVWSGTLVVQNSFTEVNREIKLSQMKVGYQYVVSCVYFLRPIFSQASRTNTSASIVCLHRNCISVL